MIFSFAKPVRTAFHFDVLVSLEQCEHRNYRTPILLKSCRDPATDADLSKSDDVIGLECRTRLRVGHVRSVGDIVIEHLVQFVYDGVFPIPILGYLKDE
jgi:hypothetical protein